MKYQSAASIGSWCQCAHELRRQKFKVVSTPFDWAFVGIDAVKHLIATEFARYFLRENLTLAPKKGGVQGVIDTDSGILIPHYFRRDDNNELTEKTIDSDYASLREPFLRRANRMLDLMRSPGPHLYVWITAGAWHPGRSAREASQEFLRLIQDQYPFHEAALLTVQIESEREPDWGEATIFNRYVPATKMGWIGDDTAWDKIMSEFFHLDD